MASALASRFSIAKALNNEGMAQLEVRKSNLVHSAIGSCTQFHLRSKVSCGHTKLIVLKSFGVNISK